MKIRLSDAGKRFNRDWIFRHISMDLAPGDRIAITGSNGSGKSTLLQAIGNLLGISEGKLEYSLADQKLEPEDLYRHCAFSAPYLELIEEFSLVEFLDFHQKLKPFLPGMSTRKVIDAIGLGGAAEKELRYFSSGMKQRVKLAQCLFSDASLLLLDEPCSNLDVAGISLYRQLIADHGGNRTIIVSSNDPQEYDFCTRSLSLMDYK